jgi:hypothetical protein
LVEQSNDIMGSKPIVLGLKIPPVLGTGKRLLLFLKKQHSQLEMPASYEVYSLATWILWLTEDAVIYATTSIFKLV